MATHSCIPAWRIPWTEKPGGLQSMGSQRVGHNWATNTRDFPGGPGVKKLPSNAGDMGSIPGWETKMPYVPGQLRSCTATRGKSGHNKDSHMCCNSDLTQADKQILNFKKERRSPDRKRGPQKAPRAKCSSRCPCPGNTEEGGSSWSSVRIPAGSWGEHAESTPKHFTDPSSSNPVSHPSLDSELSSPGRTFRWEGNR